MSYAIWFFVNPVKPISQLTIQSQDVSSETLSKFINDLNKRIFELIYSTDTNDKIAGIIVIGIAEILFYY